jgi:hypothetical protein
MPLARCFLPMCMRCALLHRQGCVSFGTVCLSSMQSAAHITQVLVQVPRPGLLYLFTPWYATARCAALLELNIRAKFPPLG